ncbi:hypothetical protein ACLOAV_008992 [Pseudogymnoascus australis]
MSTFIPEEESPDRYVRGGLYAVHIHDEYHNGRYHVLRKLGHSRYSTVWLVRDQQANNYQALKILSADCYRPDPSQQPFELSVLQHLNTADPSHLGFRYVPQLRDHFELTGPNGTHVCLVLDPMGESLSSFPTLWDPTVVPLQVAKRFMRQLLLALDYAHTAGVIHTDIKPDSIMVQIKDLAIIDRFLAETSVDQALLNDPAILPSLHPLLRPRRERASPVQPILLRAPEVVISAPWGQKVDIWNLGAVLLELVDGVHMFDARNGRNGKYDVKKHVEEMVRLFGRFPRSLLDRGSRDVVARCFHDDRSVVEPEREGTARLEDWVVNPGEEDKKAFIAFLEVVMVIDPEKRKTPVELVDEPWLLSTLQGEANSSLN